MEWLQWVHGMGGGPKPASFGPGDEVRVWFKIIEQGKERLGQLEGIVLRCRGAATAKTFTVRRVTHGEGVERVFPMDAKIIARIEVLRQGQARRSRLYFLRDLVGKSRIASSDAAASSASTGEGTRPAIPIVEVTTQREAAREPTASAVAAAEKPADGLTPKS